MSKVSRQMIERFTDELHGSGINYDWDIKETKSSFRVSNSFDTMTEGGMYDDARFTIIFNKKDEIENFKLQFNGKKAQLLNIKYFMRNYLEEAIDFTINNLGPDIFRSKAADRRNEIFQEFSKDLPDKKFEIGVKCGSNIYYTGHTIFAINQEMAINKYIEMEPDTIRKDVYANEI